MIINSRKGFTLIEIVVVIAIAGLIMGLVFTSIGGAQAARRDQQRQADLRRFYAAIVQYMASNKEVLPPTANSNPVPAYFSGKDPSTGIEYNYSTRIYPGDVEIVGNIRFASPQRCIGGVMDSGNYTNTSDWAVTIYQEKGTAHSACIDNTTAKLTVS